MNQSLLHYIDTDQSKAMADHAVRKYHGDVAQNYDRKREDSPKWAAEDRIIKDMLSTLKSGSKVLDCPVGTGRFIPYYEVMQFDVTGMDVSGDMLAQAKAKVTKPDKVRLEVGDIRQTGLADKAVDASLMIRLTRWLSPEDCIVALKELQRVTKDRVIFTARIRHRIPESSRPYELIESALDGWKIFKDEPAGDDAYRVIQLRPQ